MESHQTEPPKRRILVIINPFGGAGAAPRNWLKAKTLFDLASSRISYKTMYTRRIKHAYHYVKSHI